MQANKLWRSDQSPRQGKSPRSGENEIQEVAKPPPERGVWTFLCWNDVRKGKTIRTLSTRGPQRPLSFLSVPQRNAGRGLRKVLRRHMAVERPGPHRQSSTLA